MENDTAVVFDIHHGTTHDGPGIRSTIFFKGCPLHCRWCHNPEGISPHRQIWWDSGKCIGCETCVQACPREAVSMKETGIVVDPSRCTLCFACTKACPSTALQSIGKEYSLDQAAYELLKDRDYYLQSGGGITASGGEPALQYEFVARLFQRMKKEGVSTALDTCGYVDFGRLEQLLPYTDCFLYDLKLTDEETHERFTGKSNQLILENFQKLVALKRSGQFGFSIWIRTPLIPGATATEENLLSIARLLKPLLGNAVERWELCAFNSSCVRKYRKLKLHWAYENQPAMKQAEADRLLKAVLEAGLDSSRVVLTGIMV